MAFDTDRAILVSAFAMAVMCATPYILLAPCPPVQRALYGLSVVLMCVLVVMLLTPGATP